MLAVPWHAVGWLQRYICILNLIVFCLQIQLIIDIAASGNILTHL